jgi:hypothetical protein
MCELSKQSVHWHRQAPTGGMEQLARSTYSSTASTVAIGPLCCLATRLNRSQLSDSALPHLLWNSASNEPQQKGGWIRTAAGHQIAAMAEKACRRVRLATGTLFSKPPFSHAALLPATPSHTMPALAHHSTILWHGTVVLQGWRARQLKHESWLGECVPPSAHSLPLPTPAAQLLGYHCVRSA